MTTPADVVTPGGEGGCVVIGGTVGAGPCEAALVVGGGVGDPGGGAGEDPGGGWGEDANRGAPGVAGGGGGAPGVAGGGNTPGGKVGAGGGNADAGSPDPGGGRPEVPEGLLTPPEATPLGLGPPAEPAPPLQAFCQTLREPSRGPTSI